MKLTITVLFALTLMVSGLAIAADDAAPKQPSTAKITSDAEKMSYVVGTQIGMSLKSSGLELNQESVFAGLSDVLSDRDLALKEDEITAVNEKIREMVMSKRDEMMKKKAEEDAKAGAENIKAAEAFLAENGKKDGVVTTASGLQYQVIQKGDGPSPKDGDTVVVNYTGTLLDGKEFDSSIKRGKPAEFPVGGLIPGWNEALVLMQKGAKMKLFIHPKLAYGEQGRPGIPANSALIFEMELLDIKPAAADAGSAKEIVIPTPSEKK